MTGRRGEGNGGDKKIREIKRIESRGGFGIRADCADDG